MMTVKAQVCILGAGAGGTGCAYRLIKNGISTVVIDKNPDFGGTAVFSGVDGWEPGVSLDGIHILLKDELEKKEKGAHAVTGVPNTNVLSSEFDHDWKNHSFDRLPFWYCMNTGIGYSDTLGRCKTMSKNGNCRFQFEPDLMREAIHTVFSPYLANLTGLFEYSYKSCTVEEGKIKSIIVTKNGEDTKIVADFFADASGDIVLARDAGCQYAFGSDGPEDYNEPSATAKSDSINGVTYLFRISRSPDPDHIDEIPAEYKTADIEEWVGNRMRTVLSYCAQYPNGDISVNMLPTLEGKEYFDLGDSADRIGKARVYAYWNYLQTEKGMKGWHIEKIFDAGIRESYRLKGKYVLREQDLREGMLKQPKIGRTVAIADHALDVHGEGALAKELEIPYEIPIECAMTNEYENLFVVCRGASFSHIAAASARLTRTMLSMGEGVGEYISEQIKEFV